MVVHKVPSKKKKWGGVFLSSPLFFFVELCFDQFIKEKLGFFSIEKN